MQPNQVRLKVLSVALFYFEGNMVATSELFSAKGPRSGACLFTWGRELCRSGLVFVVCLVTSTALLAAPETPPLPTPLLTVQSTGQSLELTQEQLLALPQQRVTTTTAWTSGVKVFEGPLVRDVLALLAVAPATTASATLRAWNDYEVTVGIADYYQWDAILAHSMDGTGLTLLDHGPLWVVYPRDQHAELQDSRFDHRWAWMLRSITVDP
jgi:hypothetical protein